MQADLVEEARLFATNRRFGRWTPGLLAAQDGDIHAALAALQNDTVGNHAPGNPQTFMELDTMADLLERQGDLPAAAAVLKRSDGLRATAYPNSGSRGFFWLQLRKHLVTIERKLGHPERAEEIVSELRRLLAVADSDFDLLRFVP